jgi:Protein of unknown function (DUF2971)
MAMLNHLYRIRSIEKLLGKGELENQQIYFSPVEDLNDPVEGYKDLLWRGDHVVWRNLLKHYVLCLLNVMPACLNGGPDFDRNILRKVVLAVPSSLPDAPIRSIYEKAATTFLGEPEVQEFLGLMAARTASVRRHELTYYLRGLHSFALHATLKEFAAFGIGDVPTFMVGKDPEEFRRAFSNAMRGAAVLPDIQHATEWSAETFFLLNSSLVSQLHLCNEYKIIDRINTRSAALFTHYFAPTYVTALEQLVHPDLYLACFAANITNASMWGQYGEGHRGVALKFRLTANERGNPAIPIRRIVGATAAKGGETALIYEHRPMECHKVSYSPHFPPIDFFNSLGALSNMKLHTFWYKGDKEGEFSVAAREAFKDQIARETYWNAMETGALSKTPDWSNEEEYRIQYRPGWALKDPTDRLLSYKFEDLAGIVFGARTDLEDKLQIMRIIDKKCAQEKRGDFEFSEILFMPETSTFSVRRLDLVKIKYE